MPIHIANFYDADRRTAKADEAIVMGAVIKIEDDLAGGRLAHTLVSGDGALLVAGNYGVAYKVSTDAASVISSSTGDTTRVVSIVSGDYIVEVRRNALITYTADMLHANLDPDRGGTTPLAGAPLALWTSATANKWCASGTGGAIATLIASVFKTEGTNVVVELLA
jgi:hypothetical protein